jgi:hypothetical protein
VKKEESKTLTLTLADRKERGFGRKKERKRVKAVAMIKRAKK